MSLVQKILRAVFVERENAKPNHPRAALCQSEPISFLLATPQKYLGLSNFQF